MNLGHAMQTSVSSWPPQPKCQMKYKVRTNSIQIYSKVCSLAQVQSQCRKGCRKSTCNVEKTAWLLEVLIGLPY